MTIRAAFVGLLHAGKQADRVKTDIVKLIGASLQVFDLN
jgi:hypothetical protein